MVTDAYPPLRTSCAVQMYDLGQAFIEEGHQVSIITPSNDLKGKFKILPVYSHKSKISEKSITGIWLLKVFFSYILI